MALPTPHTTTAQCITIFYGLYDFHRFHWFPKFILRYACPNAICNACSNAFSNSPVGRIRKGAIRPRLASL